MPTSKDLIHEETTGTGTGNLVLTEVSGRVRFANSTHGFGDGGTDVFDYFITHRSASEWERGTGHIATGTNTLVRDTVIASSNSDNAVNFSGGTKDVTSDLPADQRVSVSDVREVLTANRTYYVRQDGSDSNDGLTDSSGGAFLTFSKAAAVLGTIDANGKTVTVQIGDGTWNISTWTLPNVVGIATPGTLILKGDETTPSNVTVNASGFSAIYANSLYTPWYVRGFAIVPTTNGLYAQAGSTLGFQNIDFGTAGGAHIQTNDGYVIATGDYSISGDAAYHLNSIRNGRIIIFNRTVTLSGTPAFSAAFANASEAGFMFVASNTFSGSATGKLYSSTVNGTISSFGATFPGDVAGTTGTDGVYT